MWNMKISSMWIMQYVKCEDGKKCIKHSTDAVNDLRRETCLKSKTFLTPFIARIISLCSCFVTRSFNALFYFFKQKNCLRTCGKKSTKKNSSIVI